MEVVQPEVESNHKDTASTPNRFSGERRLDTQHIRVKKPSGEEAVEASLESVHLGGMGLTRVSVDSLSCIEKLQTLWLYNNSIDRIDLAPLSSAKNLRSVSLRENRLTEVDLSPLSCCQMLAEIDLGHNRLSLLDLGSLAGLKSLRTIAVGSNPLTKLELSPLEQCEALRDLDISGISSSCTIDLTPLFLCDSLETVKTEGSCMAIDPAFEYVAAAQRSSRSQLVTSAPPHQGRPNMKWLGESASGQTEWLSYKQIFEHVGPAPFIARLMHLVQSIGADYWFHITKGFLHGLGLDGLAGIDCEPRLVLEGLSTINTYDDLIEKVRLRALELLETQLRSNGPTLFIDVERLIEDDQSELARRIVNRRVKEVNELTLISSGREVDISGLMLTAYGLKVLTAMGVEDVRVTKDVFATIQKKMSSAGFTIATKPGRLSADPLQSSGASSRSFARFVLVDRCHLQHLSSTQGIH